MPPEYAGPIRGLIFDLDGTLVDSGLDFDQMRREMGLVEGQPILEALAELPAERASECYEILALHEERGAEHATLMPGVVEFLAAARARSWRCGLMTRNCRRSALATLERLALEFDPIICRDDGPIKPDPAAVLEICRLWQVPAASVAVIGDYRFDLEAGRRAGARTALLLSGRDSSRLSWAGDADFVFDSFLEADQLLAWLAETDLG